MKREDQSFAKYIPTQKQIIEYPEIDSELSDIFNDNATTPESQGTGETLMTTLQLESGREITVPRSWHPSALSNQIVSHNNVNSMTNVLVLGRSGGGKTNAVSRLLHSIHTNPKNKRYVIKWFSQYDILDMKNILKKMTKGLNYIFCFDDQTYVDQISGEKERLSNAREWNILRHKYLGESASLIAFHMLHYSKSAKKGSSPSRNSDFTIALTCTGNEVENYKEIFPNKWILKSYQKLYRDAVLKGKWSFSSNDYTGQMNYYNVKDVRPILVNSVNHTSLALMPKRFECEICSKDFYSDKKEKIIDEADFVKQLRYPPTQLRKTIRWFAFLKSGNLQFLTPQDRKMYKHVNRMAELTDLDWEKVIENIDMSKTYKTLRRKNNTPSDKATSEWSEEIAKNKPSAPPEKINLPWEEEGK